MCGLCYKKYGVLQNAEPGFFLGVRICNFAANQCSTTSVAKLGPFDLVKVANEENKLFKTFYREHFFLLLCQ